MPAVSFIRDGWSAMFGDASDDAKEYTQEQRDALRSLRDDLENDRITVSEFADKRAALMGRYGQEAAEHAENIEDSDGTWAVVDEAVRTTAIVAAGIGTTLLTGGNLAAGIGASMAVATVWDVGNDVNATTDYGATAIEGDPQVLLRRHPLNLARFGEDALGDMRWGGSTALHGAALRGADSIVRYLVEKGAKVDARNNLGWTPRTVANGVFVANTEKRWPSTVALLEEFERRAGGSGAAGPQP